MLDENFHKTCHMQEVIDKLELQRESLFSIIELFLNIQMALF